MRTRYRLQWPSGSAKPSQPWVEKDHKGFGFLKSASYAVACTVILPSTDSLQSLSPCSRVSFSTKFRESGLRCPSTPMGVKRVLLAWVMVQPPLSRWPATVDVACCSIDVEAGVAGASA